MRYKEGRDRQKSRYGCFRWLKWSKQKTYGVPEPIDNNEPTDTVVPTDEDDYNGADHD
jgi:hypothetical protein